MVMRLIITLTFTITCSIKIGRSGSRFNTNTDHVKKSSKQLAGLLERYVAANSQRYHPFVDEELPCSPVQYDSLPSTSNTTIHQHYM